MLAAYYGHSSLVELLIEHGADPNRVNDRGQSPLAGAVFKGEDAVIEARTCSPSRRGKNAHIVTGIIRRWSRSGPRTAKCIGSSGSVQTRREMGSKI